MTTTNSAQSKAERIVGAFVSLMSSALTMEGDGGAQPLKDSSGTLPRFISCGVHNDSTCFVFPALLLKHGETSSSSSSSSSSLEETAAWNLAQPVRVSRDALPEAPMNLLASLCESFSLLIDSRLRSSIAAFVRQTTRQKDPTLTRVMVGLLACSQTPITPTTVVTSFRVIPGTDPRQNVVMPLVMEAIVDLKVFGTNLVSVTIVAPGTIQATFGPNDVLIQRAELVLDTVAFLQSMMKQARSVVRKAVAIAANMATNLLIPSSAAVKAKQEEENDLMRTMSHNKLLRSISSISSINTISSAMTHDPAPALSSSLSSSSNSNGFLRNNSRLMPPPPSRPSRLNLDHTVSLSSLSSDHYGYLDGGSHNATWGTTNTTTNRDLLQSATTTTTTAGHNASQHAVKQEDEYSDSTNGGLSLLTAAAGLKRPPAQQDAPEAKRQRIDPDGACQPPPPARVTSCPRFEAAV